MEIREGYMPFLEYKTYYRVVGKNTGNKKPLVLLHGGPGSTHNYFEVLDRIAEEDGRQLVMYDQIGCGNSYVENRPDLWNSKVWIEELIELRKHLGLDEIHLLGQSWGGMQARRTEEYHSVQYFAGIMAVGGRGTAYDRADATGYAGCY